MKSFDFGHSEVKDELLKKVEDEEKGSLSLICYNVLAQAHLENTRYLYAANAEKHLTWAHRFNNLRAGG